MENKIKLGEYIREIRKLKKYSLRKLGEITDISYSHLSKIERGEHIPEQETLEKLSKALRIDKNRLLILAGYLPYEDDFMMKLTNEITDSLSELSKNENFEELLESNIIENYLIYQLQSHIDLYGNNENISSYFIDTRNNLTLFETKYNNNNDNIDKDWIDFIKDMKEEGLSPNNIRDVLGVYNKLYNTFSEIKDCRSEKFKLTNR